MKIKILLIEDDLDLGMVIKQYLELSNFEITWLTSPQNLIDNLMLAKEYKLIILDIMLPVMDGFQLSKEIKQHTDVPFIFLTAKGQSMDRILGLKLGADDYISKPCEPEELLLRIKNILKKQTVSSESIRIGYYNFNPFQLTLKNKQTTFQLTEKESELLFLLSQYRGNIISRSTILEKLWGENDYFLGRSLDVFMTRLRKYLQEDSRIKFESIRGVGFRIEIPESMEEQEKL